MTKTKIEFVFGAGFDRDGNKLKKREVSLALKEIQNRAACMFGGFTLTSTTGGWINPAGNMVIEPGFSLFVLVDGPATSRKLKSDVQSFTAAIRCWLHQESVVVIQTRADVVFHAMVVTAAS